MNKLRLAAASALLAVVLAGIGAGGAFDVAAAGHHGKTHPTATHAARRQNHHGSGVTAHQHHARHERHARHHGQTKHHQ